jgi:hypothetical protein
MLTENQKDTFQELKEGKLTSKQKTDFYYRMSKILKSELEGIEELSHLLEDLPDSYLEKIDFTKTAIAAMELTEKLVKRLDPAYPSPIAKDIDGNEYDISEGGPWKMVGRRVIRHFKIDMSDQLPGLTEALAGVEVSYEPFQEEVALLHRLTEHQMTIKRIRDESANDPHIYGAKAFNEAILPKLKTRGQNFDAKTTFVIGDHQRDVTDEESIEQFTKIEEAVLGIEPQV